MLDANVTAERVDAAESDDPDPGEPAVSRRLGVGDRFAGFQIRGILGRGAMGVVYEAWDPVCDRRVALKLLCSPTKRAADRVLREAKALTRASHPGLASIVAADVHRGALYLALELVEGQSLAAWLETPRTWRAILPVLNDVARGVAAAHAVGVLHRDIRPENVLVGVDGQARVVDFGLRRLTEDPTLALETRDDAGEASCAAIRLSGSFAGLDLSGALDRVDDASVDHRAPEQRVGERATARSDQYAVCATFFTAIYGVHPSAADTRDRSLAPRWLDRIMLRGLAEDPSDRYPSMQALVEALARRPARQRRRAGQLAFASVVVTVVAVVVAAALLTS